MTAGIAIAVVTAIAAIAFLILGEGTEAVRYLDGAIHDLRALGSWAWLGAIALICADLVLPIPASSVIAGLGAIYGLGSGFLVGAIGLIASGSLGYGLVRLLGRPIALALASESHLSRLQTFFERSGAWAIVLTRGLPLVPEVVACLAGLAGMKLSKFLVALTLGSLPLSFVFSAIGAGWRDQPSAAMAAAYVLPLFFLPVALHLLRGSRESPREQAPSNTPKELAGMNVASAAARRITVTKIRILAAFSACLGMLIVAIADPDWPVDLLDWFGLFMASAGVLILATSIAVMAHVRSARRVLVGSLWLGAALTVCSMLVLVVVAMNSRSSPGTGLVLAVAAAYLVGLVVSVGLGLWFSSKRVVEAYGD